MGVHTAINRCRRRGASAGLQREHHAHLFPLLQRLRDVTRRSLNISKQLEVLELPTFEGRQHSGIDVSAPAGFYLPYLNCFS